MRMLNIRLATEDDRPVISEVSKHYDSNLVHMVYNTWMQRGCLYIAEQDGEVVGLGCLDFPAPTDAQILGLRLLPKYRKEETGRQLVIGLMQLAQERGCNTVRILTSTDNWETQAALQHNLGFERRGIWVVGYREKLRKKFNSGEPLRPAAPQMLEDIWQYLQYSQTYRRCEGLIFCEEYTLRGFTKAYLAELLEAGQVYAILEGGTVAGVAVVRYVEDSMILRYVDARPKLTMDLLQGIICAEERQFLTSAVPFEAYHEVKPYLEHCLEQHAPDQWLVMEKEVFPLALPRDESV